jgi:predicted dehydrogenase
VYFRNAGVSFGLRHLALFLAARQLTVHDNPQEPGTCHFTRIRHRLRYIAADWVAEPGGRAMKQRGMSRRRFLKHGVSTTLGLAAFSYQRVLGANERVVMGIIGSGGRGRGLMQLFLKAKTCPVEFAGVCDVYEANLAQGMQIAGSRAKDYEDYRQLLAQRDIQAVIIATPDHWHHRQLLDALAAGKDVYLEKPMSWSIEQGLEMVSATRRSKQIVQVGMQRRSAPLVHEAWQIVREGTLGEVNIARAQWFWNMQPLAKERHLKGRLNWQQFCGPAGPQPLDRGEYKNVSFLNWRYFWAFSGGNMTDQGTHLMDVIQWFLNDGQPPRAAVCYGQVYRLQPSETPDTFCAVFEYPKFLATWTLAYTNSYQDGWKIILQGNKATLELDNDGYRVYPDPGRGGKPLAASRQKQGALPSEPHVENFLECVHSRRPPNAPVEVGHNAVLAPHLANLAYKYASRAILRPDGKVVFAQG